MADLKLKPNCPLEEEPGPQFGMLPTDRAYGDWPKSGEIDIMEHVGYDQNNVHFYHPYRSVLF